MKISLDVIYPPKNYFSETLTNFKELSSLYFKPILKIGGIEKLEIDDWIRALNNKLGKVRISYCFLKFYFELFKDNSTVKNHDPKKMQIAKFWFNYHIEAFFHLFYSSNETFFHLLNSLFGFKVKEGIGFSSEVIRKLRKIDGGKEVIGAMEKHGLINSADKTAKRSEAKKLRHDLVHNFPPYEPKIIDFEGNKIFVGSHVYSDPEKFMTSINDLIKSHAHFLRDIENKL